MAFWLELPEGGESPSVKNSRTTPHLPLSASVPIRSMGVKEADGTTAGVNNDRRCDKGSVVGPPGHKGDAQRKLIARDRGPDGPIYEHTCVVLGTCLEKYRTTAEKFQRVRWFRVEIKIRYLLLLLLVSFYDSLTTFAAVTKSLGQTSRFVVPNCVTSSLKTFFFIIIISFDVGPDRGRCCKSNEVATCYLVNKKLKNCFRQKYPDLS